MCYGAIMCSHILTHDSVNKHLIPEVYICVHSEVTKLHSSADSEISFELVLFSAAGDEENRRQPQWDWIIQEKREQHKQR